MKTYFVFGFYEESWWPLWEDEMHRARSVYNLLSRIRKRLIDNGEMQYEEIAAVECRHFWGLSMQARTTLSSAEAELADREKVASD